MSAVSRATVDFDEGVRKTVDKTYDERKCEGLCTYPRCDEPASDTSSLCTEHHERQKERDRNYRAAKRAEWREAGLCNSCGAPRHQGSLECAACLRRRGRLPKEGVHKLVDKSAKRLRVQARIIAWENSPQNEGRVRMRGGERGRRPMDEVDNEDIAHASEAFDRAADAIKDWRAARDAPIAERLPKIQLGDLERRSMSKLVEAGRWIAEVVKRHGYEVPVVIVDDED